MPKNDTIFKRLEQATDAERKSICEILKLDNNYSNNLEKISAEFRSVSGHTVANIFRDPHAYEYLDILKDTWNGVKDSKKEFSKLDLSEEILLENNLEITLDSILKNTNSPKKFKEQIASLGNNYTAKDAIIGGGTGLGAGSGIGAAGVAASGLITSFLPAIIVGIGARLISAPLALSAGVVGLVTVPSYKKSFLIVVKLIEIKKRLRAEEKLKDGNWNL